MSNRLDIVQKTKRACEQHSCHSKNEVGVPLSKCNTGQHNAYQHNDAAHSRSTLLDQVLLRAVSTNLLAHSLFLHQFDKEWH